MGNHVTPAELAQELGMDELELLSFCSAESIPVLHGRVDRTLVRAQMAANNAALHQAPQQPAAGA